MRSEIPQLMVIFVFISLELFLFLLFSLFLFILLYFTNKENYCFLGISLSLQRSVHTLHMPIVLVPGISIQILVPCISNLSLVPCISIPILVHHIAILSLVWRISIFSMLSFVLRNWLSKTVSSACLTILY